MHSQFSRILGVALLLLALSGCKSDEQKREEHMARGDAYVEEEQWDEAIIEYKNVLQIDPNDAAAHFALSQAFLKSKQPRKAFWELRETVRLDPSNHDAVLQFAQLSIYAGELEEALKRAEDVIAAEPKKAEAYVIKAQAHEGLKQPDEAGAAYRSAYESAPDNLAMLLLLADFLRREGDRAAAEPLFRKGPEVESGFRAYSALGGFLAEDREHDDEVEAAYRKAVELAEQDDLVRAYSLLGGFYYSRDRFDDTVAVLEEGIERAEDPVELIYLLARLYRAEGNEAKADELAERATEARPDDPGPLLVLSAYRGRQGDLEGALVSARKAVEVAPGNRRAKLRVAEVLLELGFRDKDPDKVTEGREIVEAVLVEEPSSPDALFVKSKIELSAKQPEAAVQSLRTAIDLRPDWAEAHFLLGTALVMNGERTAARTELARALELDASLVEARRILAEVHAALGEHEYAIEEGRRYLGQKPEAVTTRIRVAQSLLASGQVDAALAEVEAIDESQRDMQVEYAIGRIYLSKGDRANARKHLTAALAAEPRNPEILGAMLQLDRREGQLESSAERINAAVAANPDDAALQKLAGTLALAEGRGADAEAAFKRAIELDPDSADASRMLAEFYARTGRTQQAIETYEQALAVRPDQPQLHHLLGVLYEFGGQTDRAIEHYEEAIRYAPNQAESKNNLAYLFAESGENLDRALDLAQEAKALMPDDPNTSDTLGWVLYRRGVPTAAIGYLKEAEAGMGNQSANLGLVRYHLALAYEATGDKERALQAVDRALEGHDAWVVDQKAQNRRVEAQPPWYAEAQQMKTRL